MSETGEFLVLGIDPGLKGALAWYFAEYPSRIAVEDMPVVAGTIDGATIARRIRAMGPSEAIIEQVASRPGQGVSSVFTLGRGYGTVLGVLQACNVPLYFVTPATWKRHFNLSKDKDESRAKAINLWPASEHFSRKKDDGRAEAALLARYHAEKRAKWREVA